MNADSEREVDLDDLSFEDEMEPLQREGTFVLAQDQPMHFCSNCFKDLQQVRVPRRGLINGFFPSRHHFRNVSFSSKMLMKLNFSVMTRVVFSWKKPTPVKATTEVSPGETFGATNQVIAFPQAKASFARQLGERPLTDHVSIVWAQHTEDDIKQSKALDLDTREYQFCIDLLKKFNPQYKDHEFREPKMLDGSCIPEMVWDCVETDDAGISSEQAPGPASRPSEVDAPPPLADGMSTGFSIDDKDDVLDQIADKVIPLVKSLQTTISEQTDEDADSNDSDNGNSSNSSTGSSDGDSDSENPSHRQTGQTRSTMQAVNHFTNADPVSQWDPLWWMECFPHLFAFGSGGPNTGVDKQFVGYRVGSNVELSFREQVIIIHFFILNNKYYTRSNEFW